MYHTVKLIVMGLGLLVLASCAAPVNSVSFGKKCESNGDKLTSSYIWFYDSKNGLPATADQCPPKAKKQ